MASTWCMRRQRAAEHRDGVQRSAVEQQFSSRRVPDCDMSIAGQTRRSASLRSSTSSMLPVPLNSWKISVVHAAAGVDQRGADDR